MELNGKPFIPPTCPVDRYGDPVALTPDKFHFMAVDDEDHNPGPESVTAIIGYFGQVLGSEPDENGDHIETGIVEVPQRSDEARQARAIDGNQDAVNRMGALFCERIIKCRGVVDGECWALGARAVIEVVRAT